MDNLVEEVNWWIIMEYIRAILLKGNRKVKVYMNFRMDRFIREILKMGDFMDEVSIKLKTGVFLMVSGYKDNNMGEGYNNL